MTNSERDREGMQQGVAPMDALRRWLEEQLHVLPPGSRLPTQRELARSFNVSLPTVKRLLAQYSRQGIVQTFSGRGSFISGGNATAATPSVPERAGERLAALLARRINTGQVEPGQILPGVSQLSATHGVSFRTASKALAHLEQSVLIERRGRQFRVLGLQPAVPLGRRELVVFDPGGADFGRRWKFAPIGTILSALFAELIVHGYRLRGEGLDAAPKLLSQWSRHRPVWPGGAGYAKGGAGSRSAIPCAILFLGLDRASFHPLLQPLRVFDRAIDGSVPMLLDCFRQYPANLSKRAGMLSRMELEQGAARVTIRFLQAKGVAGVLFCHPGGKGFEWAAHRYGALQKAARGSLELETIVVPALTQQEARRGLEEGSCPALLPLRRRLGGRGWHDLLPDELQALLLAPLFEDCFSRPRTRFWICANDAVAAAAIHWAKLRGVKVPHELMLMGFDHDLRQFHLGLTSYDFRYAQLGYRLAHFLLGDLPPDFRHGRLLACEGQLFEKDTTEGPPPIPTRVPTPIT